MKISGYVCVRNGIKLDYCFQQAIESLIPACDELVVCDSDSNDGTDAALQELANKYPSIKLFNRTWTNPNREITWWTDWLNWVRERLEFPIQLTLDADEVLCPKAIPVIRAAAEAAKSYDDLARDSRLIDHPAILDSGCKWFHRLNFWRDAQHLAPHGRVCGEQVVRMGLTKLWMPSDEPHPEGLPEIQRRAGWPPNAAPEMRIFHYGFLRKEQALIDKVRVVNGAFFGTMDERLIKAEKQGTPWINEFGFDRPLINYYQEHPEIMHNWLTERGYEIHPR
jgi:glycosyltransferase involved in cell wall biosynthesis